MLTALHNGRVMLPSGFVEGHAVIIDDDRIIAIVSERTAREFSAERHDLQGHMLLPGFIDTQVNGGGGVLFNDTPSIDNIARNQW